MATASSYVGGAGAAAGDEAYVGASRARGRASVPSVPSDASDGNRVDRDDAESCEPAARRDGELPRGRLRLGVRRRRRRGRRGPSCGDRVVPGVGARRPPPPPAGRAARAAPAACLRAAAGTPPRPTRRFCRFRTGAGQRLVAALRVGRVEQERRHPGRGAGLRPAAGPAREFRMSRGGREARRESSRPSRPSGGSDGAASGPDRRGAAARLRPGAARGHADAHVRPRRAARDEHLDLAAARRGDEEPLSRARPPGSAPATPRRRTPPPPRRRSDGGASAAGRRRGPAPPRVPPGARSRASRTFKAGGSGESAAPTARSSAARRTSPRPPERRHAPAPLEAHVDQREHGVVRRLPALLGLVRGQKTRVVREDPPRRDLGVAAALIERLDGPRPREAHGDERVHAAGARRPPLLGGSGGPALEEERGRRVLVALPAGGRRGSRRAGSGAPGAPGPC